MDVRQLRYFTVVAEELSFSRAAERLEMTQPPLSRQIHLLEQELGVTPLRRTKRRVALTRAGRTLLSRAYGIIGNLEQAATATKAAAADVQGTLRLGCPVTPVPELPYTALGLFRERYPEAQVQVSTLGTRRHLDLLQRRKLGLSFLRLPEVESPELRFDAFYREPMLLALAKTHPLAAAAEVDVAQLHGEPLALYERDQNPVFYDYIGAFLRRADVAMRIIQESLTVAENLPKVAAGEAVTFVSRSMAAQLGTDIVTRPLTPAAPTIHLGVAWYKDDTSVLTSAFLETVREVVRVNA